MKHYAIRNVSVAILIICAAVAGYSAPAVADITSLSAAPVIPTLKIPAVVDATAKGVNPVTKVPVFTLGLKWNEQVRQFSFPIPNDTGASIDVLGVRTSGGLYVAKVPNTIPAKGTAKVTLILSSRDGSSNSSESIYVLTSDGEKTFEIARDRESVVTLSASTLKWALGETVDSKEVTVTLSQTGVSILGVRAANSSASVKFELLSVGKYKITIAPGSTDTKTEFPVFISYNVQMPDVPGVIVCQIAGK